jgi:hypothetical protein
VNEGKNDDDSDSSRDNNNNLLQYYHMKNFTYNSSSHYILIRGSVILYLYWYNFNPFMVFVLKLWMTKYSSIQHCMLLLYLCCMHICNDFFWLVPTMLGAFVLISLICYTWQILYPGFVNLFRNPWLDLPECNKEMKWNENIRRCQNAIQKNCVSCHMW